MPNSELTSPSSRFWQRGAFLFAALVLADQMAKLFAHSVFKNSKFAFSLPLPIALIYFIYGLVLLGMIIYTVGDYKSFSETTKTAWVFIFAGAVSNIGERIILGYVRDFIYISFYRWTGIYNLADGYIILGILLLLFSTRPFAKQT